jgi:hypothetical protein
MIEVNMKKIFSFLFVFSAIFYFAQYSVDIVAKWKVNDVFPVQFTSEITDSRGSQKVFTKSIFDSKFTVNQVDDSQISITWIYSAAKMDVKENNLENIIISKILNQPLKIKLSETGKYDSLENTSEIKNSINKILGNELAKTSDETKKAVLNIAKNLVKTDEGVALLVTKNIKAYLFSFGYQFIENKSETHDLEISNPFGGENFLATETVEMTSVNEDQRTCIIKTKKVGNGDQLKISVVEALKKANAKNAKKIDAEIGNAALEFSENTEHIIDYDKGIVNKGFFKRTMNFGFQNRVQLLKFSILK